MTRMYQNKRKICNVDADTQKADLREKAELRERAAFIVEAIDAEIGGDDYDYYGDYSGQNGYNYMVNLPDIKELEDRILKYIVGQDQQVRQIITAIYKARCFKNIKSNILIIGKSGTGKTETIKRVAEGLNIPYTIEDATKYTQEGYCGADVNDMILNLLDNACYDVNRAENGILVIDEIDKKAGSGITNDVSKSEVLKSLLKIIEGTTITLPDPTASKLSRRTVNFSTKNLIIIFLGAFSGLEKIREKRLNKNQIGFLAEDDSKEDNKKTRFLKQDLIEYGMPEEFVGRIDTIVEMKNLTKDDLIEILKRSRLSIFKTYKKELKRKKITLYYSGHIFKQIARESLAIDTGARELNNTVNYMFENIIYEVLANPGKYRKCKLLKDIVTDNTKYILS